MADLALAETVLDSASVADPSEAHLVLWNTARFYDLRPGALDTRVRVDHHDEQGRLVGSFVGGHDDDGVVSGYSAPFGGIDVVKPNETVANVERLVAHALDALPPDRAVEVRAKPPHYGANEAVLEFALLNRGFAVTGCELNFHLDLASVDTVDGYVAGLKPAARKMLRRSEALGLDVHQVAQDDDPRWAEAYEVLRRNRVDRGRPMRLPLEYVRAIRDAFPGRVRLIVASSDGAVCAAALVYRIAPGRDLVQYWGDAGHALAVSPMNVLVRAVVEHALAAGAATIDIGISSEDGVPNHGLVQFKRSVGCRIEPRLTLVRRSEGGVRP